MSSDFFKITEDDLSMLNTFIINDVKCVLTKGYKMNKLHSSYKDIAPYEIRGTRLNSYKKRGKSLCNKNIKDGICIADNLKWAGDITASGIITYFASLDSEQLISYSDFGVMHNSYTGDFNISFRVFTLPSLSFESNFVPNLYRI